MDEDFGIAAEQRDAAEPDGAREDGDHAMLDAPEELHNGGATAPARASDEERLPVPEAMEDAVDTQGAGCWPSRFAVLAAQQPQFGWVDARSRNLTCAWSR